MAIISPNKPGEVIEVGKRNWQKILLRGLQRGVRRHQGGRWHNLVLQPADDEEVAAVTLEPQGSYDVPCEDQ